MCVIFYYKTKSCNHFIGTRASNCGQVSEGQEVYCSKRENRDEIASESHCAKCVMSIMVLLQ